MGCSSGFFHWNIPLYLVLFRIRFMHVSYLEYSTIFFSVKLFWDYAWRIVIITLITSRKDYIWLFHINLILRYIVCNNDNTLSSYRWPSVVYYRTHIMQPKLKLLWPVALRGVSSKQRLSVVWALIYIPEAITDILIIIVELIHIDIFADK